VANGLTAVVLSRHLGFDCDADLIDLFAAYCLQQEYVDRALLYDRKELAERWLLK
jgi:hypothetical protein